MYRPRQEFYPLAVAALNAGLSWLALSYADSYPVVRIFAMLSFALFGIDCLFETRNILFLARTFILGFIGYFPMIIKVLMGEDALFSAYEPSTQGFGIAVTMYAATSFALLSNQIGLALADRNRSAIQPLLAAEPAGKPRKTLFSYWHVAGFLGIGLTLFSSAMFVRGYGQTILVAGYGSGDSGKGLPFGSVGILGGVGIFSLFVAGAKGYIRHWKLLFVAVCCVFIVYSQLLMGARQDAMSTIFGLLVLYGVVNGREIGLKLKYLPMVMLGYAFFEVWGLARTMLAEGIPISSIITLAFTSVNGEDAIRLGTISPIATTFSNTVFLVDNGFLDLALGRSYWEWILRIPPEALYPDRPQDYAWIFESYGLAAGGGFFELAEVHMNFGLFGALLVPGLISFAMAQAYYGALSRQGSLNYFLLFAFLAIFLRGTWYQTFAFFRGFLVCIILYFVYAFISQVLRACARTPAHSQAAV